MEQQFYQQPSYDELMALKAKNSGKGAAATVFGVFSLIMCLGPISLFSGILAIIIGAVARKKSKGAVGTAGLTMGVIGTILSLITTVILIFSIAAGVMAPSFIQYTEKSQEACDLSLCQDVATCIEVALADSWYNEDLYIDTNTYYSVELLFEDDSQFAETFRDTIGRDSYNDLVSAIKSTQEKELEFCILSEDGKLQGAEVRIPGTDISTDRY